MRHRTIFRRRETIVPLLKAIAMTEKLTKAQERIKTSLAHYINLKHPVAMAIEPLRVEALKRAKKTAEEKVAEVRADLEANGWDCNKAAPYPATGGGYSWQLAHQKYVLYRRLVKFENGSWRHGEPHICKMDSKLIAKFIADRQKQAGWDYDAFVVKLCKKIGDCEFAALRGDHIWNESYLSIRKANDEAEVWKTRQIDNVSKNGLWFNQWPSRKMKGKAA